MAVADLVDWQVSLGRTPDVLLAGTGIPPTDLHNPEALITPLQEQAFFRQLMTLEQREDLGLDIGARYRLAHFGHLGLILPHAATRRQAIELFVRFINLSYTHFQPELDTRSGVLSLRGGDHLGLLRRFYLDRDIAFAITVARQIFRSDQPPIRQIRFDYALAGDAALAYAQALGAPVVFGADCAQIEVDARQLDEVMPDANALLVSLLQPQCEAREMQVVSSSRVSWTQRTQAVLAAHPGHGPWPDTRVVSSRLNCSERTLRRQLALEGASFQQVSDAVRSERAARLLAQPHATLDDLANRLGYSEAAAFIRAYRRWFGRPPGMDRRHT